MSQVDLLLEALSALTGCTVETTTGESQLTPQDIVNISALKQFYKQEGLRELEYPSLGSLSLAEEDLYSSPLALTEGAPAPAAGPSVKINPKTFFDPQYDYDFTHIKDTGVTFMRGAERYVRPCGWKRFALRVLNSYEGNEWLGTGSSSWPVSYHGNRMEGTPGLILVHRESPQDEPGFLEAAAAALGGDGDAAGRGVYSSPDVDIAEEHCKRFKSRSDGKMYKVVLQNRINPEQRKECQREGYWLVYVPEGFNQLQTRAKVQMALRPYGMLLKQE